MEGGDAYREAVGRTIHALRGERAWSLRDLSAASGVSIPYLSEIERGRKEPSGAMLAQIAAGLDVTLAGLLVAIAETIDRRGLEVAREEGPLQRLWEQAQALDEVDIDELARYAAYLQWRRGAPDAPRR